MALKKFRGTPAQFYIYAKQIITSFLANQAAFATISPSFTVIWGNAVLAALEAAHKMPDIHTRRAINDAIRDILIARNIEMGLQFKAVKGFIFKAYPTKATQETQYYQAGWTAYKKAIKKMWAQTIQMGTSMVNYLTTYSAPLLLNNNMPPNFLANFLLIFAAFQTQLDTYLQALQNSQLATEAKENAFNAVNEDIQTICQAALLLPLSPYLRQQFNITYLLDSLTARAAGLDITITSGTTGLPVPNAAINIVSANMNITVYTNAKGKYKFHPAPAADYYMHITHPDHYYQIAPAFLNKGRTSKINIQLKQI